MLLRWKNCGANTCNKVVQIGFSLSCRFSFCGDRLSQLKAISGNAPGPGPGPGPDWLLTLNNDVCTQQV